MEEKKQEKKGGFFQGFLVLLLLILAGGGGILYKTYHDLQQDYRNLEKNKDQIVAAEVKAQISEAKEAEHDKVMEFFRVGLEEEHTIDFLRTVYKEDYLVYERASHFLFRPLLDVEMADYSNGSFVKDSETGFIDYQVKKQTVSKRVIDVSKYQGEIDWNAVKASGIDGAIIRVGVRGYGSGELAMDATFEANIKGATAAGLDVGAYFFSEAITEEEAVEEAEAVKTALKDYNITLPVVCDLELIEGDTARNEKVGKKELTKVTKAFLDTVKDAGYTPMLYGNIDTIYEMVDLTEMKDYQLWFAYYNDEIYIPYQVNMWQYASDAKVGGISTDCDINLMFPQE